MTICSALPVLSLLETRVLAVLAEKQYTVPDTYPLTLNTLVTGCNQRTSRDPIMNASQVEIQIAIDNLKHMSLVIESSGGRAARFAHNLKPVLQIPIQSAALMTTLMLRGPQTAGELRINSERLHKFADISSVESFLAELAERTAGALVMELPRQPGSRENRWMHLLSGTSGIEEYKMMMTQTADPVIAIDEIAVLKADMARLSSEVSALRKIIAKLCTELDITIDD
ncbi:hypothetical protein SAMN05216419_10604 [Nitrosomonas cryotolerans]|uniref:Uncharacterized protein n=1 Tax=Nitrosomonas cryotolerans ATCC 49181 TaxID=1131553 RepID=A0A1N6I073_9PROT|nr:YceH family protein [Nitrosomonas cryotolerans]SFQ09207.1 hypothetical protein SAMN05216419_10604 [Nitrosomonas cryotolerans]SIO25432.1 hypothetical protein SAMN02743940_1466 [Nitrosomonas cryotolerans ATCC 49181]